MATITLATYHDDLRTRFFTVKGVTNYLKIAKAIEIAPAVLYRFAHGHRVSWENTIAIEAWIIAQEQARGLNR
jgi:hypothetical protein